MSGRQSGSRVSHSSPQIVKKHGGVCEDVVSEKRRKLRMLEESNSDYDTAILASKLNINKVIIESISKKV